MGEFMCVLLKIGAFSLFFSEKKRKRENSALCGTREFAFSAFLSKCRKQPKIPT
jgi:hypothetical protein